MREISGGLSGSVGSAEGTAHGGWVRMSGFLVAGDRYERQVVRRVSGWARDYLSGAALADLGCAIIGVLIAAQLRFGSDVTATYLALSLAAGALAGCCVACPEAMTFASTDRFGPVPQGAERRGGPDRDPGDLLISEQCRHLSRREQALGCGASGVSEISPLIYPYPYNVCGLRESSADSRDRWSRWRFAVRCPGGPVASRRGYGAFYRGLVLGRRCAGLAWRRV